MKYDWLIVGAGLFGATFARLAADRGLRCLVVDKRNHTGGNIYCENIEGINVHKYGAHIFHTSDRRVWDFVTSLVDMNRYVNQPLALAPDGNLYHLPFNMNTFHALWGCKSPEEAQCRLDEQRRQALEKMHDEGATEPRNLEEQALSLVGEDIYRLLIKDYTEKQWGRACRDLPASIIRRLPVRLTYDNNYFNDLYQGIPEGGYNILTGRLLAGSDVRLDIDFLENRGELSELADKILFTGPIDAYFDYKFGRLEWRTVSFTTRVLNNPNFQGNAVVNYTGADHPYTRIIEHKHFEMFGNDVYENPKTVVSEEYPAEWQPGMEPYYPVNDDRNRVLYDRYRKMGEKESGVIFGGRLGTYSYLDMDKVIASALSVAENVL